MRETQNAKPKLVTDFRSVLGLPYWISDVNESWSTTNAIEQIEVYCEVLEHLEMSDKSNSKSDRYARLNVRAVNSSYAFEIAMKSFWALDNPENEMTRTHKLLKIINGLREDTLESLKQIGVTRESICNGLKEPFIFNRYSMERREIESCDSITSYSPLMFCAPYTSQFLRDVNETLKKMLAKRRDEVLDELRIPQ